MIDFLQLPLASATGGHGGGMSVLMADFILQLAVIIIAARLGGMICGHVFKLPEVLGELTAGIIIGPYALGGLSIAGLPPLFPLTGEIIEVSTPLYGIATVASVLLLFTAGLETDLKLFLKYSFAGIVVGLGGVIASFGLGAYSAVWLGIADEIMEPSALFMGVISTATSVGITARIMAERHETDSPEGVTIMAAAVLDDVVGIILLAVVGGMTHISGSTGHVPWSEVGIVAAKALGFWLVCTAIGILLARKISSVLKVLKTPAAITSLGFGLALLLSALSEKSGLALIIGAYIAGMSASTTDLAHLVEDELKGVYNLIVPVFFCVMGMLVDLSAMSSVLTTGLIYTGLAILAKVFGCGIPARLAGFNLQGSLRIGLGMLPRGEVALIIAGMGLSMGVLTQNVFGIAIMMTVLTTLIAPPLLVRAFEGGTGVMKTDDTEDHDIISFDLPFPSEDIADFVLSRIILAFHHEEFFVHTIHDTQSSYQVRKDEMSASIIKEKGTIHFHLNPQSEYVVRFLVLEELLVMQDVFDSIKDVQNITTMSNEVLSGLFKSAGSDKTE